MSHDLEIICEIEKILNIKFTQVAEADIVIENYSNNDFDKPAYSTSDDERVTGLRLNDLNIHDANISIAQLLSLTTLCLCGNELIDITFIETLINLRILDLRHNNITEITGMETLINLKSLNISDNNIYQILGIETLANLQTLNLWNNKITEIMGVKTLTNLQTLDLSNNRIGEIKDIDGLTNLQILDLRDNYINEITGVETLINLENLDLSGNHITEIIGMETLTNLKILDLSYNFINEITGITTLMNLKDLDLSSNEISEIAGVEFPMNLETLNLNSNEISEIADVESLTNLKNLDLSNNEISEITGVESLTNLQNIDLSNNEIIEITGVEFLTSLQNLALSFNYIIEIAGMKNLTNLQNLDLSNNGIYEINGIEALTNLRILDLNNNEISEINGIETLTNLENIDLSDNQITDISGLQSLSKLQTLYLGYNQITDISGLQSLSNLQSLHLSANQITELPDWLLTHPHLQKLTLRNNPIKDIEPVLLESDSDTCLQKIRDYCQALNKFGYVPNNEVKLLLLGNGRAGKSSIVDRLLGKPFDSAQPSTHGIRLCRWELPLEQERTLQINMYDFGGQDIYHGTHRLFMAQKTLYLLVWEDALEHEPFYTDEQGHRFTNYPLTYWLDYIRTFSPHSPVILVQNKTDLSGEKIPADYNYLGEHFRIAGSCSVSALKNTGFPALVSRIGQTLQAMDEVGRKLPKPWLAVKENLQALAKTEKRISLDQYKDICNQANLQEISATSARSLLSYLHDSGTLYYDGNVFNGSIILDQKWAIEAIYTIFDRDQVYYELIESRHGKFTRQLLAKQVWRQYTQAEQEVFLGFMKSCELCFPLEYFNEETDYIAPQLLPASPKDHKNLVWNDPEPGLSFIYEHQYFHTGILYRFIARIGQLVQDHQEYYRDFIIFQNPRTRTQALVEYLPSAGQPANLGGQLSIRVKGKNAKQFLDQIRNEFEELNQNAAVTEYVSVNGLDYVKLAEAEKHYEIDANSKILSLQEHFVPSADFKVFFTKDTGDTLSESYGGEKTKELIMVGEAEVKKVFVSYAHEDAAYFNEVIKQLAAIKLRTDKIDIWHDERIPKGAAWEPRIMAELNKAAVGILLISKDFFASDFIVTKELPRLLQLAAEGQTKLLMLILNHCGFGFIPDLNKYQTMNPPDRPLSELSENERDKCYQKLVGEVIGYLAKS